MGAAVALGNIQNQSNVVVPALIRYFQSARSSSNVVECEVALRALARHSPDVQAAVPLLVSLLNDPDLRLREGVRECLARIDLEKLIKAGIKTYE
jgi:HEAT repeat protein